MYRSYVLLLSLVAGCGSPQETEDRLAQADAERESLQQALDAAMERIATLEGTEPGQQALRLGEVEDDIDALQAGLGAADDERAALGSDLDALTVQVDANTSTGAQNAADILIHAASIEANGVLIAGNAATLRDHSGRISDNASNVKALDTKVTANSASIASGASSILANASQIATNLATGSTNASAISTNTAKVTSNTAGVDANKARIATNKADITTNEADITATEADIDLLNMYTDLQWSTYVGEDGRNTGEITGRKVSISKASDSTDLDITYYDNFRVYGHDRACRWEVLIDGKSCTSPGAIIADDYHGLSGGWALNSHRLGTVQGICRQAGGKNLTKGAHTITVSVGSTPGYSGSDCHTGWKGTRAMLSAREIPR